MDIFTLSASLTLDSTELDAGLAKARAGFAGITSDAHSAEAAVSSFASGSVASVSSLGASFEAAWADIHDAWSGADAYFSGSASSISATFSQLAASMAGIGHSMWEGLMSGFDSAMAELNEFADSFSEKTGLAARSLPVSVDFSSSALGKSSAAQINAMLAGMNERGGNYSINLVVDGRTLANVMFDPLNAVSKQKGVTIGA